MQCRSRRPNVGVELAVYGADDEDVIREVGTSGDVLPSVVELQQILEKMMIPPIRDPE